MTLGLHTIASAGDSKSAVLGDLFATTQRSSVLGAYRFDADGDTTLRSYGLYQVDRAGEPVFEKAITPTRTVH